MIFATPNRGTGGAGARGILQGMIAGQQSRQNDQRMEALQTQMNNQREDRAKTEFNEAMFNMELGGSPDEVNNIMAKYPDLYLDKNPAFEALEKDYIPFNSMTTAPFDFMNTDTNQYLTTKFKRLNAQDLIDKLGKPYNEDGTINMKHLNKLRELRPDRPITEEMFADPSKYSEYINNGFVLEEQGPDGSIANILMTPEMFEAGSANYASYKRKRLQDEALTKAKLTTDTKGPDEITQLANLREEYLSNNGFFKTVPLIDKDTGKQKTNDDGEPLFTKVEDTNKAARYNILKTKNKMTKPYAEQTINAPYLSKQESAKYPSQVPLAQVVDNSTTKKFWNPASLSPSMINVLKQAEFDTGREYKGRDDVKERITSLSSITEVRNDLLRNDTKASGLIENAMLDIAKLSSSAEFQKMSKTEQLKFLNTVEMRAKIGNMSNALLKALSGADVTEEQYNRVMGQLLGGDIDKVNNETIVAALGGTADSMYNNLITDISQISSRETPGTKAELAVDAHTAMNRKQVEAAERTNAFTQQTSTVNNIISTDDMNIDDTASQALTDVTKEGVKALATMFTAIPTGIAAAAGEGLLYPIIEAFTSSTDESKDNAIDSAYNSITAQLGIEADDTLSSKDQYSKIMGYYSQRPEYKQFAEDNNISVEQLIGYIGTNPGGNFTIGDKSTLNDLSPEGLKEYLLDTSMRQQGKDVVDGLAALAVGGLAGGAIYKGVKGVKNIANKGRNKKAKKEEKAQTLNEATKNRRAKQKVDLANLRSDFQAAKRDRLGTIEGIKGAKSDTEHRIEAAIRNLEKEHSADNMKALQDELKQLSEADKQFNTGVISNIIQWVF